MESYKGQLAAIYKYNVKIEIYEDCKMKRQKKIINNSLVCSEHLHNKKIDVITELQNKVDDYLNRALG